VATYDPKKILAIYGLIPLSDFGEGSFIEVTPDQDDFRTEVGTDGTVDFVRNIGLTYTVKMSIAQTSITNDLLSAARLLDLSTNTGPLPLAIKDLQGLTTVFFRYARIVKSPSASYSGSTQPREWIFKCILGEMLVGGNIIN
jgi:hypothetical protein